MHDVYQLLRKSFLTNYNTFVYRYNEEARPWYQTKYKRRRSQMIGLGDGISRDSHVQKKPFQPLTVLPQLKVAVVPLSLPDHSNPVPTSYDTLSPSASTLGFTVIEDRIPTRPSIDYSTPPPNLVPK